MFRDSETGVIIHRGVLVRSPILVRLLQLVNLAFSVVYTLLGVRFLLAYIGARTVRATELVTEWSEPLYRPFRGIVADGRDAAGHTIIWSLVMAFVAYALFHAVIGALLRSASRASTVD